MIVTLKQIATKLDVKVTDIYALIKRDRTFPKPLHRTEYARWYDEAIVTQAIIDSGIRLHVPTKPVVRCKFSENAVSFLSMKPRGFKKKFKAGKVLYTQHVTETDNKEFTIRDPMFIPTGYSNYTGEP